MSALPEGKQLLATAGAPKVDKEEVKPAVRKSPKRKYSPRTNLGFHLLIMTEVKKGDPATYVESGAPPQKSLNQALRYIKDNADDFKDKKIMIAHLKKEVSVAVTHKVVAEIV